MSTLATMSSSELRKISERELVNGLADMSPTAIDRFRRMRKLTTEHNSALDTFLRQHPEKRMTASGEAPANKKAVKANSKTVSKPAVKPAAKKVTAEDDGYVQLWMRMRAWWDGVDLEEASSKPKNKTNWPKPRMDIDVDKHEDTSEILLKNRLEVMQHLWGEGNSLPGGSDLISKIIDPFSLKKGMTVADFNAGLGGGTRYLTRSTGAIVQGFDSDKDIAEVGHGISKAIGADETAPVSHLNFDNLETAFDQSAFDLVLAREFLFSVQDRKAFFTSIADALKPDGTLIFTDYCLADRSPENKAIVSWRQIDPLTPRPATGGEHREMLTSLRYDVKSMDDISDAYVSAIQSGWKSIVESLKSGNFSRAYVDALMQEGQIWLSRSRAIESGHLRVVKTRAVMSKGPKRSLTDSMSID